MAFNQNSSTNSILEKLQNNQISPEEWLATLPTLPEEHLEYFVKELINKLEVKQEKYLEYLQKLLEYDRDEDRLTGVLDDIFRSITSQSVNEDWFCQLSKEFLTWNTSELLVENFFIFLKQKHEKNPLQYESKIIQQVESVVSPIVAFYLMSFLIQSHLHIYENTKILQLFYGVSLELQLAFIPTISNLPKDDKFFICKQILFNKQGNKDDLLTLSILFLLKTDLELIFSNYS